MKTRPPPLKTGAVATTSWLPAGPTTPRMFELGVIACYNNDLENFWDYIDDGRYPLKPSVEAFRLGINFALYAMTH